MKKLLLIFAATSLFACKQINHSNALVQNQNFDQYKTNFINNLWDLYPNWASSIGFHKADSILTIPDDAQRNKEIAFAKSQLDSLHLFNLDSLNNQNKTDYYLIENQLKSSIWNIEKFKSYQWNPAQYNVSEGFAEIINNNYGNINEKLLALKTRLKMVPTYYEAAKKNIVNPTLEHTALAIDQNTGGLSVFQSDLVQALTKSSLSAADKTEINRLSQDAISAIQSYCLFLKDLKNEQPRSFRIGKELYEEKFAFDIQSNYTAEGIYQKALAHKKDLHQKMYAITLQLWPKYFVNEKCPTDSLLAIRKMIDRLSIEHVQPAAFQAEIEKQIPTLVQFIKEKNLIYIDPSKPLVVRKEPAYMAGVAGASISSPGPYDKNGNTYYNVGSLAGWDEETAESYLREYNKYILQILNIHEAIPGHYTQLVYANQSPSLIKSILGNGAMIEGWAVYTEKMMLENGYGNNDPAMWLMYYKWNLRSTCNTIIDYSIQVKNMQKDAVINLLTKEAFQQQAEAEGKWKRATLTQVQLCSYFTGFTEIVDLRTKIQEKEKEQFDLKKFHETFLSFGSAPIKYISELMN
ncbi:MAG: hypothetical protein RI934_266 [Bacteroidota bacterium]|jgi:uncharacterized protein (DUF885 family)